MPNLTIVGEAVGIGFGLKFGQICGILAVFHPTGAMLYINGGEI